MKLEPGLIKSLTLALGLPTTIFSVAFLMKILVDNKVISPIVGVIILVNIVAISLFLMVWYANKNKN